MAPLGFEVEQITGQWELIGKKSLSRESEEHCRARCHGPRVQYHTGFI